MMEIQDHLRMKTAVTAVASLIRGDPPSQTELPFSQQTDRHLRSMTARPPLLLHQLAAPATTR